MKEMTSQVGRILGLPGGAGLSLVGEVAFLELLDLSLGRGMMAGREGRGLGWVWCCGMLLFLWV